jgi:hypothetical protein
MREKKKWFKKEIKPAFKSLKLAMKTKDKALIKNALCWLIASCEASKVDSK